MLNIYALFSSSIITILVAISLASNNILVFWVLIEVSSFFLVYIYLNTNDNSNISFSSFIFFLSNGLSSILIIFGVYFNELELVNYGVMCKFFVFPFSILLLYIFENSSWILIFLIGSLFKGFTLCLSYLFNNFINNCIFYSSSFSILVVFLTLMFFSLNLKGLWFVLNLSSSVILYLSCIILSNNLIWGLYCIYLIISFVSIYILSGIDIINSNVNVSNTNNSLFFLFSMVGFPISLNFIYKLISIYLCLTMCSLPFLIVWGGYICFETGMLLLYFNQLISNNHLNY